MQAMPAIVFRHTLFTFGTLSCALGNQADLLDLTRARARSVFVTSHEARVVLRSGEATAAGT